MPLVDGRFVGYDTEDVYPIKRGDRVRIKKGQALSSTHPDPNKKRFEAKRTYVVTINHIIQGMTHTRPDFETNRYVDTHEGEPVVRWPGTGGYWFSANLNDVEKVDA